VRVSERRFVRCVAGDRALSAPQLPWFTVLPPRGFGVITTTGAANAWIAHNPTQADGIRAPRCAGLSRAAPWAPAPRFEPPPVGQPDQ